MTEGNQGKTDQKVQKRTYWKESEGKEKKGKKKKELIRWGKAWKG